MIEAGDGKYRVWLKKVECGDDLVYVLGGGERPHVGGTVLKVPGKRTQTLTFGTHRDLEVLRPIAEVASERHRCKVAATGGVHIDDAGPDDIELIVANCNRLLAEL